MTRLQMRHPLAVQVARGWKALDVKSSNRSCCCCKGHCVHSRVAFGTFPARGVPAALMALLLPSRWETRVLPAPQQRLYIRTKINQPAKFNWSGRAHLMGWAHASVVCCCCLCRPEYGSRHLPHWAYAAAEPTASAALTRSRVALVLGPYAPAPAACCYHCGGTPSCRQAGPLPRLAVQPPGAAAAPGRRPGRG